MKTAHAIAIVASLTVAGASQAEGPAPFSDWPEAVSSTLTRAQVVADLREAQRLGQISHGEIAVQTATPEQSTRSRAQVVAELREAQRLGLMSHGEIEVPTATPEQEQQIADAGRRAAERERLATK